MSKKIFKLSLVIVILAVLVSGCTLPWKKEAVTNTNNGSSAAPVNEEIASSTKQLKKFGDYGELKNFLEENNYGNLGFSRETTQTPAAVELGTVGNETFSNALDTSVDSSTNNQVAGATEADIIKTDGTYIYALVRNELKIIKVNPASEATVISTITFESRPQDIFISGTSLSVFGSDQQIYNLEVYKSFYRQSPYTFFKVFDLSDPVNPKLVRDLDFEGSYTDARLVGDYVHLFTNSSASYITGESLVSRVLDGGSVLSNDCAASEKCFAPDVYYFDIPYDSYNFFNITTINIKDNNEEINGQSYLVNYGQNLYVSQNNIYITYTEHPNEYDLEQTVKRELIFSQLSVNEQAAVTAIESAASYILNKTEKKIKIASVIDNYLSNLSESEQAAIQVTIDEGLKQKMAKSAVNTEKTEVYKIAINGRNMEYRGLGEINGQVLNQLSLNENGNYFRIATTHSSPQSGSADESSGFYSNIYILNDELKIVGSLENLATNENISAVSFIGDRAYLTASGQTDPIYVVGLSDPAKPSVLGAVKVPGFSTYLHPVDKNGNKLIGIGRDTTIDDAGNATVKGLKISLFDFTDLTKPKELDSHVIGEAGSDSIALSDHKTFLYSEGKNLLVLPAVLKENDKLTFSGSLVFNITDNKLVLKGKIDHSGGGTSSNVDSWNGYSYYDNTVKRSLYINDNLITFSNKFLKINNFGDLSAIKSLTLTGVEDDYIITPAPILDSASKIEPDISTGVDAVVPGDSINTGEAIPETIPEAAPEVSTSTSETIPGEIDINPLVNP